MQELINKLINYNKHKQYSPPFYTIRNIKIVQSFIKELPYNSNLKERATAMRQVRNLPEVLFWKQVSKGSFYNIDFDRQRIIGNYIVDFYVKKLSLAIEIDGASHNNKVDYDNERELYLLSLGIKVHRISVNDILKHMPQAMAALELYIIENYSIQ